MIDSLIQMDVLIVLNLRYGVGYEVSKLNGMIIFFLEIKQNSCEGEVEVEITLRRYRIKVISDP